MTISTESDPEGSLGAKVAGRRKRCVQLGFAVLGVPGRRSSFGHLSLCPTHVLATLPCVPSSQLGQ